MSQLHPAQWQQQLSPKTIFHITQTLYTWSVVWLQCILAGVTRHVMTIRLWLEKGYTRRPGQHRWGATPMAPDADLVLHLTTGKLVVQSMVSDVP